MSVEIKDPIERMVAEALERNKIKFVNDQDPRSQRLDFYLPDHDVHIEVKQFHSDRIAGQMGRVDNVIAIQGKKAAQLFVRILDLRRRY